MAAISRCFLASLLMSYGLLVYADISVPSINDLMSIDDQKKTGVIRLTQQQKMALAKWLVDHRYNIEAASDDEIVHALTVALNVSDGKIIELSDNSVWEISPDDRTISQSWLSPIPVKVTQRADTSYPYLITNLRNNQSVKAKKGLLP